MDSNIRNFTDVNLRVFHIKDSSTLTEIERIWRMPGREVEVIPLASGTVFAELAEHVIPDRMGDWVNPLVFFASRHKTSIGAKNLCTEAVNFMQETMRDKDIDILSAASSIRNNYLELRMLIRSYSAFPDMTKFFERTGESLYVDKSKVFSTEGKLIIPDEIKEEYYSPEEIEEHRREYQIQQEIECDKDHPLLNQIDKYIPKELPHAEDHYPMIYDLRSRDMQMEIVSNYNAFMKIFYEVLTYINGVERYSYANSLNDAEKEDAFLSSVNNYIRTEYVEKKKMYIEDLPVMVDKINRAIYQLYIVQDLIDDPNITDINITAPDSIRVKVIREDGKAKTYISNISFIDQRDYERFIDMLAKRNNISLTEPEQVFTDTHDENYILRFALSTSYVNSVGWPYLHIRKESRNKMLSKELLEKGFFDEKIRDFLLDAALHSRGIVFAGEPGSGKTVALNWLIEEGYELTADILCIQESDELFANRKGVRFQHVVRSPRTGYKSITLEELGEKALVAGANVFIIGEVKGAEICSAITLSNSGCRTAMSLHSESSTDTIDKMVDLALRGYATSEAQAKRMLKAFQTIVYMRDFKVQEITEITGYDAEKNDMTYRYIYRREEG